LNPGHRDLIATRESYQAVLKKIRQDEEVRRLESEANQLAGRKPPSK
jgi:hypothetical protein